MELRQTMIIAGVGCRKGAAAAEIEAAIAAALTDSGLGATSLDLIATAQAKEAEPGIAAAAAALGVRLVVVEDADLALADARTVTRSEPVRRHTGVSSVAEAAALAAGGPSARLLAARIVVGPATCALATTGATP
jgi:cobalt-precorrin 5A hydrolase